MSWAWLDDSLGRPSHVSLFYPWASFYCTFRRFSWPYLSLFVHQYHSICVLTAALRAILQPIMRPPMRIFSCNMNGKNISMPCKLNTVTEGRLNVGSRVCWVPFHNPKTKLRAAIESLMLATLDIAEKVSDRPMCVVSSSSPAGTLCNQKSKTWTWLHGIQLLCKFDQH